MARFYGKVGYGVATETVNGVYTDVITEIHYRGDVVRNARRLDDGVGLNKDISVTNSISIIADAFANGHIFAMRYVEWMGSLWTVDSVEVQRPRLLLRLGGLYNGPTA